MIKNDERNEIIKAAEQGDAIGQYNLGAMYDYGEGVDQNYWMAEKWYTLAAKQGDADAQYNLGVMYHKGQGLKMLNYTETWIDWFVFSLSAGN